VPRGDGFGEAGDRSGIGDVEDLPANGCARPRDPRRGVVDAPAVTAGEVDDVAGRKPLRQPLGECESETLVGPGDDGDARQGFLPTITACSNGSSL
jgi:hypothetical protein